MWEKQQVEVFVGRVGYGLGLPQGSRDESRAVAAAASSLGMSSLLAVLHVLWIWSCRRM
jgi:hypothetical protein